ncbi:MAG TPA: MgtC/SapB family protein, partial [Novosphingobium sp.]|nr:MgtC/SapB family protein [Novosphingobium sp.]
MRTFGLLGLAGAIAGHLARAAEGVAMLVMAAAAGLIVVNYARVSRDRATISGTASLVGLITLASGFLAGVGERFPATGIVVVMVLLLTMRERLHQLVEHMSEVEVAALARFALIAAVVLPLLPDQALGPLSAWNPRQLWLV